MPRRTAGKSVPPTTILFVRHGTTPTTGKELPGQGKGLHLSDQGRAEAQGVAERIAALPEGTIKAVYASTLERAQETAAAIAAPLALDVRIEADLADCDVGEWTGRQLKELYKEPEWGAMRRWPAGFRFPGGESAGELQARVASAIEKIRADNPGSAVVAVSHADPIKTAVGMALGAPFEANDRMAITPCSVSAISYGSGAPVVLVVNSGAGLSSLGLVPPKPARRARKEPGT